MKLALFMLLNSCLILKYLFLNFNNSTQTLSAMVDFYCCRVLLKGKYLFSQPYTNLQPHICQNTAVLCPDVPWLWSCYWLISVMSAPGCRKEEVTSNLPFFSSPQPQILLLRFQLKPLEQLLHHMGEASKSEETWPLLWECSLTTLFIFNCQKSLLIHSSPFCVIRSVVIILQPEPSLRCFYPSP